MKKKKKKLDLLNKVLRESNSDHLYSLSKEQILKGSIILKHYSLKTEVEEQLRGLYAEVYHKHSRGEI
ncbi:MAG: hypothetical protein JJU13_06070 [Balneolaceae bacterium]|nr:hypothetical protein [Balneolaceae bacterium]